MKVTSPSFSKDLINNTIFRSESQVVGVGFMFRLQGKESINLFHGARTRMTHRTTCIQDICVHILRSSVHVKEHISNLLRKLGHHSPRDNLGEVGTTHNSLFCLQGFA
jgi:hypothetical protein